MDTYYHGSPEQKDFLDVTSTGLFDGVFVNADQMAAESHGDYIYKIELDDDDILDRYELIYNIDYKKVLDILVRDGFSNDESDKLYDFVVEDHEFEDITDEIVELLNCEDRAYASWELQRLNGVVAKSLGFKAIEMNDEHGTSYLVVSGNKLERIEYDKN